MLIEFLVEIALSVFSLVISLLPSFNLAGLEEAIEYVFGVLSGVCYFLPMETVSAIVAIIYSLFIFRLLVGSLRALWGLLPLL